DADGVIQNIKVTDASNETPGLGSKTTLPDHTNKFQGVSGTITSDKASTEGTYIAPVTGASYSSKAVFNAVAAALAQYAEIGGAF
ncbi:MAG: FMN-binding protein, partial [Firmicutes bacterium]|nr:FMN-binding protein [Bacillota bacterium]